MSPAITFFIGLVLLVLFGWYFATDLGPRKRFLATLLMVLLVAFSIFTIWPPKKKIQLGLDIQGGTSFLIRLVAGERPITKDNLDQAVEVIRKRVDYFGGGEPVISPVGDGSDPGSDSRARSGENQGGARSNFRGSRSSSFGWFIRITANGCARSTPARK